jgi:hypothetical protein
MTFEGKSQRFGRYYRRLIVIGLARTRLVPRCARCNRKVVLAQADLAKSHGTSLPVWKAIDRPRCHRRLDGASRGGSLRRVVLAECDTYGKTTRITREIVVRDGWPVMLAGQATKSHSRR